MKFIYSILLFTALACSGGGSSDKNGAAVSEYGYNMLENEISSGFIDTREQKLIKESYLRFETKDLDKTYAEIADYVKANKGYIQSDGQEKGYNEISRELIIRIPSGNFQQTIDAISKNVAFFDEKRVSSTDVTEEFIDLEARLKAKRALEARYLELLNKAQNVKDILEIEKELAAIREEIESREGRLKYLENQVSYSTLTVNFYKRTSETGVTVSYGAKIRNAVKSGFNGLSYFFLGLVNIWPFIVIVAIIAYSIRRKYFKKNKT